MNLPARLRGPALKIRRAWFDLTAEEQKALLVVLALFLLGLAVRWWRLAPH